VLGVTIISLLDVPSKGINIHQPPYNPPKDILELPAVANSSSPTSLSLSPKAISMKSVVLEPVFLT